MTDVRAGEENEYVLGTGDDELSRLGFQHAVWAETTAAIWRRAGFATGWKVLDVGCGPGYATFDLARLVGPTGRVVGIDVSQRFVEALDRDARARGAAHVEARLGDVTAMDLPEGAFDGAWARWVLCFVPDPEAVVAKVARALRPGGTFAVMDYARYAGFTMAPRSAVVERVLEATAESFRRGGGDPDVGQRVPGMMMRHGLEVREVRSISYATRPTDARWEWPISFFRNFLPTLVQMGLIDEDDRRAFLDAWAERAADPAAFFLTPPMVEVAGVKR